MKVLTFIVAILIISNIAFGQDVTETEAIQAIVQAEKDIQEMVDAGFGIVFVNDTLLEARKALNASNYSLVVEKTRMVSERKVQAYNISDSLRALELGIVELEKLDLNTSNVRELLDKSITAFKEERYEETEELIAEAYSELSNIRAEATIVQVRIRATRENIISFVQDNWLYLFIGIAFASAIGYIIYNRIEIIKIRNKIKDLEIEQEVLKNLIKKAQLEHFQKRTLSRESYEIKIKKYRERMLEIKELLPVLKARVGKK